MILSFPGLGCSLLLLLDHGAGVSSRYTLNNTITTDNGDALSSCCRCGSNLTAPALTVIMNTRYFSIVRNNMHEGLGC